MKSNIKLYAEIIKGREFENCHILLLDFKSISNGFKTTI